MSGPEAGGPGVKQVERERPRAVVWDVGHVLYDWDPRFLYRKLIPEADRLDWFLENVVTRTWHFQHDAGRPFHETSAELVALYPDAAELILAYGPRWLETIPGPMPGTHRLVEELAAAGIPQFGITNFSGEFWDRFRPTSPLFDLFGDVVVSGHEKLVKPDPAIYALARSRFALGDGDALFIDDNAANVDAAISAGWFAHRFTDAASARAALRAHQFPV
ncbi:MAG: HAD family hydrolase [Sandaracinobacteroides sp.]